MGASVYSQRLGPIAPAQVQAALSHFGLGGFVRAAPTCGGLFGQNLFVTSDQGEYVLRGWVEDTLARLTASGCLPARG